MKHLESDRFVFIGGVPAMNMPQVKTVEDTIEYGNAMAAGGNYPLGLDPCFVAGISGISGELGHCPFEGQPFCKCKENEC